MGQQKQEQRATGLFTGIVARKVEDTAARAQQGIEVAPPCRLENSVCPADVQRNGATDPAPGGDAAVVEVLGGTSPNQRSAGTIFRATCRTWLIRNRRAGDGSPVVEADAVLIRWMVWRGCVSCLKKPQCSAAVDTGKPS